MYVSLIQLKKRYLFIIKAIHLPVFLSYLSYVSTHIIYVCIRPLSVDVSEGYDVFAPLHTNLIYVSNLIQNFLLLPLLLIVQVRPKQVNLCQVRPGQLSFSSAFSNQLLFQPRSAQLPQDSCFLSQLLQLDVSSGQTRTGQLSFRST